MLNYLLPLTSVFFQTLIPLVHLPVMVIIWICSREKSVSKTYLIAFSTGLFADLIFGYRLGILAGLYLFVALMVWAYKLKFRFNWLTLVLFWVVSQIIFFYARGIIR